MSDETVNGQPTAAPDPDAADTPEWEGARTAERLTALEEHVVSLRSVAAVLTLAMIGTAIVVAILYVGAARRRRA